MDRAEVHSLLNPFLGAALRVQDQDLADGLVQRKHLGADIHAGPAADAVVEIYFRDSGHGRFHHVIGRFAPSLAGFACVTGRCAVIEGCACVIVRFADRH